MNKINLNFNSKNKFKVYGNDALGKGVIVEVWAYNTSEALEIARNENIFCKFNHANI